jgi:hypothetical protein
MQEFEFVDNRKVFWFLGALVLVAGLLLTAFLMLSGVGQTPGMGGPDIRLPKIGTLPPRDAPQIPPQINRDRGMHP